MTSALENTILIEYFQYLQRSYSGTIPIKNSVLAPSFQHDGICVLNADTFILPNGVLSDPSHTNYVWLKRDLLMCDSKLSASDLCPIIAKPLSTDVLCDLFDVCCKISKHNLIPTLLLIGGSIQSFHYQTMVKCYSNCPIIVATGEAETGKSTALRAGLSLYGCDEIGRFVKGTNALFLERACSSCLPFAVEEGKGSRNRSKVNQLDISKLIIDISNGSRSANMKTGIVKPKTVPLIASNFDIEDLQRYADLFVFVPVCKQFITILFF